MNRSNTTADAASPGSQGAQPIAKKPGMKLAFQQKAFLITAVALAGWFVALYTVSSRIVLGRFARLEQQNVTLNVQRARDALFAEIGALDSKAGDWSTWDDAYTFMSGENPDFIAKNVSEQNFYQLKVDLMAFIDISNRVAYAQGFDDVTQKPISYPDSLLQRLTHNDLLVQHTGVDSHHTGLMLLPEGILLVASRPILNTQRDRPMHGSLVFGTYLEADKIENLERTTHNSLAFYRVGATDLPADVVAAGHELNEHEGNIVRPLTGNLVAGYTIIKDVYGRPALWLRLEMPRDIYAQGRLTMNYFFIALLAISVVFGAVAQVLLQRTVFYQLASKESEKRYRAIIESSEDAIISKTLDGVITSWNRGAEKIFGYSAQEALGHPLLMLMPPDRRKEELDILARIERGESVNHFETVRLRKSGERIDVAVTTSPIKDGHGRVIGASKIARDITERKRAEEELRASEERYRAFFETAAEGILVADIESKQFKYANPAICKMLGYTAEQLTRLGMADIHPPEALDRVAVEFETQARGEKNLTREIPCLRKDGVVVYADITTAPVVIDGRKCNIGFFTDITEHKQEEQKRVALELQLRQAQKLETIGQLAAGIAHEINTPTQFISDNTRFVQDAFQDVKPAIEQCHRLLEAVKQNAVTEQMVREVEEAMQTADPEYLLTEVPKAVQQSLDGLRRVAKIVQAMKDFSHPGSESKTAVDLNRAIESTITVARNEWKYVSDLVTEFDPELPPVPCLPGEFNQVILNMLVNAAHAIADVIGHGENGKGKITISTRRMGDWVEVRISDTGTGIPEAARSKIFDPFFTTKPVGKGTGQGLAIARSVVVDKHGGNIDFETELGQGTTFIIRLPLQAAQVLQEAKAT